METRPLVSVVVPLYNKEEYILDTLNSILQQSFADFEVLVVNDGSTDKSLAKLKLVSDRRVRIIDQKNQGVAVARNNGIKNALGKWISFLDADDLWDKRFLEKMTALPEVYPDGEIFSSGRQLKFQDRVTEYNNHHLPKKGTSARVDYIKIIKSFFPPINSSSCLINKELLVKSGGFKPGMKNYEDHDLWIRLAFDKPIYFLNEPLSIYRKDVVSDNSGSKSSLRPIDFINYLETLKNIKLNISSPTLIKGLECYAFKFCSYNYLLNAQHFNGADTKVLRRLMKEVVGKTHYCALFIMTNIKPSFIKLLVGAYKSRRA